MRRPMILAALALATAVQAGGDNLPVGARIAGMGQAGLTLIDLWGVRHNQAGLAGLTRPAVGVHVQRHWLSEALDHQALAAALPLGRGTIAVSADNLGYALYREMKVGVAYAMRFGEGLRVGVQLDYLSVRLGEGYGSRGTVTGEVGVQARLTERLWAGAHLYNPSRAALGGPYDERVPTVLKAGLGYTFSDKLVVAAEVVKDIDEAERFHAGLEYRPVAALFLRTGVGTGPVQGHAGVGVRLKGFDLDLAVAFRSLLGPTPQLGLSYRFP
ncbi:MAG: hypothetical protein IT228_10290 [Flavobacteriales bacterium]|nr:hypothetical protein [Flavobacteriales bacterium]MCC6577718.1 hypothetical protein [Flavobacteriales bacterium]NUQ14479.1 hypothetical protein [Flavobacteriales bacterium]